MDFATLANVKTYIGLTTTIYDAKLTIILDQVNYDITSYGGGTFTANASLKNGACRWVEAQFNRTSGVKSETNIDVTQTYESDGMPSEVKAILDRVKGSVPASGGATVDLI